jgi:DNA end-binding protein Ku
MAPRSSWKGFLRLSLVAVPVKAYPASASGGGDVHLHQLHAGCHSRIRYHKVCPLHGQVQSDAVVSGYEYTKDQYIVVDPAELDKFRGEADHAITIAEFIAPDALDPLYASGKSYYLLPDGPVGQKPYAVLARAMREAHRHAIARVVLHSREQVVLVRPVDRLLVLCVLHHHQQIARPATFQAELPAVEVAAEELNLARTLIDASTRAAFDLARYPDGYTDQLRRLLEAKAAGKKMVAPLPETPQVINLMEALQQSVARLSAVAADQPTANGKPAGKLATGARSRVSEPRRRKIS